MTEKDFDFEALSKGITDNVKKEIGGLSEKFSGVDDKFSSIERKIESLSTKKTETDTDDDDDLDDDLVVSKKDLAKILEEREKKLTEKIKGSISESLSVSSKQKAMDSKAFEEFPFLSDKSVLYSKEFEADVKKEVQARLKDGVSNEDPRLLLDSARAVAVSNPKYLQLKKESVEDYARQMNNRDGSFSFKTSTKEQGKEITGRQLDLASRLGMDRDKVAERLKKMKN